MVVQPRKKKLLTFQETGSSRLQVGTNYVITDDCDDDYFEACSEERFDDFDNEQREVGLAKQTLLKARAVTGAGRREIIKMIYSRTY